MKRTLTAGVLSLAIAAVAGGAATAQVWQGDVFFTKTTSTCNTDGDAVGDFGQGVFSPVGTNGNSDRFALFSGRGSALQFTPSTGPLNGATSFTITLISHTYGAGQETVTSKAGVGPLTVSPPAPTASNQTVTISGPVKNFANISGCNVTLQGTLYLVPGSY
ncbi:MAG: hypothetical protein ACLPX9_11190 [Rhodomicrobium sp.]